MYMPLCRECHARESKLNAANAYEGDPTIVKTEMEKKQFENGIQAENRNKHTPTSSLTGTTASNNSPAAKSFSSEDSLEHASGEPTEAIRLRSVN